MALSWEIHSRTSRVQAETQETAADFRNITSRIANIPCNDSTSEDVLRALARWNNPGKSFTNSLDRFANSTGISLGPKARSPTDHPTMILFRNIKAMISGFDRIEMRKAHWNEVNIDQRWHSDVTTRLPYDTNRERPLYERLKRCKPGSERGKIGWDLVRSSFMHSAVHDTVNHILASSAETATREEVEYLIGSFGLVRPLRQRSLKWRSLSTPSARRTAVWTLAVSCSIWGMEFAASFLEFCTAALIGPICGATRNDCKEGFAACVALATIARARSGSPITSQEIASCARACWVLDVLEKACTTAQGTLWTSRYITKLKGPRVPVKACNKWESPITHDLKPSNLLFVTGIDCTHPQKENKDGTHGGACAGRWIPITKTEELELDQTRDLKMRVTLTHTNAPAVNNVLALLEQKGQWSYVQGKQECLTCAYRRALRHGFPVVIDSPQCVTPAAVHHPTKLYCLGTTRFLWTLLFIIVLMFSIPDVAAQATVAHHEIRHSIFKPDAICEQFFGPPVRGVIAWKSLFGIIRAFQAVVFTLITIRSGKRFVSRKPHILITSVVTTLMAGLSGWMVTQGCAATKSVALMKGLVTASVNRLSYEAIDTLSMVVSMFGVAFTIIYMTSHHNPWALLQSEELGLICLSISYVWRWRDTGMKQLTSSGSVGTPLPLFVSHFVALALIVIAFVFNAKKDTASAAASYVSDSLFMAEVLLQFLFLV